MPENLYPARLKQKVTVAPRSQTNRNVFSARLNRSVDKSAECREDTPRHALSKTSQSRRGLKQTETSSVPVWTVQWTSRLSAERTGDCSRQTFI